MAVYRQPGANLIIADSLLELGGYRSGWSLVQYRADRARWHTGYGGLGISIMVFSLTFRPSPLPSWCPREEYEKEFGREFTGA